MNYLLATFLLYTFICAFLFFYQRNLMYFPDGDRPGVNFETVPQTITVEPEDGIMIEGWYWPAQKDLPTIVFFHGNGHAYQYWVDKLMVYHREGYGALFTDYRGYGGAAGQPSEEGLYHDARSFITALNNMNNIDLDQMIFYGESLGAGIAVQMALEFPAKAVILESAKSSAVDIAKRRYWMLPVNLLMKDQYRNLDKIHNLNMPKFFIHGERDMIIPIAYGQRLYDAAPEPKQFRSLPNAGHNDLYEHGAGLHISAFLSRIMEQDQ